MISSGRKGGHPFRKYSDQLSLREPRLRELLAQEDRDIIAPEIVSYSKGLFFSTFTNGNASQSWVTAF